ncbi:MAG: transcription antitermination factor NusB [Armatimonadetes bacterium]|nr:transcription antitermination factor NusB [Armatimonadota bacterium]
MSLNRRPSREWALRTLYQIEVAGKSPVEALEEVVPVAKLEPSLEEYLRELVMGICEHRAMLDKRISDRLKDWTLDRLAVLDRNVLRIGAYELIFNRDLSKAVALNEAVELAKKYGTEESGRFVNGVLGAIADETPTENGAQ